MTNAKSDIFEGSSQGNEKISVTGVELNKTSVSINVGETSNLIATVKPENAKELFEMSDIDGGLIGGASLKAKEFSQIVNYDNN